MSNAMIDILIFKVSNRYFAIESSYVYEIMDIQPVTPLPFVSNYIDGLISVDGQIAAQIDFSRCISLTPTEDLLKELIILNITEKLFALKIDEVVVKLEIDSKSLRSIAASGKLTTSKKNEKRKGEGEKSSQDSDTSQPVEYQIVKAEFEWNKNTVIFIEANSVVQLMAVEKSPTSKKGMLGKVSSREVGVEDNAEPYLVLTGSNERFAFLLDQVVEIIPAQEVTPIPGAPESVAGLTVIRDMPLLVLFTGSIFDRHTNKVTDNSVFLVIHSQGERIGLIFDEVLGILNFSQTDKHISKVSSSKASGILVDENEIITTFLEPSILIDSEYMKAIKTFIPECDFIEKEEEKEFYTALQVQLDNEWYAIPVDTIKRIIDYSPPEKIDGQHIDTSNLPIVGLTDLDGAVIPVINIIGDRYQDIADVRLESYVIVGDEEKTWALSFQEAKQLINIPISQIEKITESDNQYIDGFANYNDELVSIVNMSSFISNRHGVNV